MKKIFLSVMLGLMALGQAQASDLLTVADVTVPYGSETTLEVSCAFETQFKAYQFDLELGAGATLVTDSDGRPVWENGFGDTDHSVSAITISEGKYRFVCTSLTNSLLPMSGALLRVKVTTVGEVGDTFTGRVTAAEFTTVDYEAYSPSDTSFTILVGETPDTHVVMDENSSVLPEAQTGVDVRVRRTILADEWSTIALPFAMTAEQCQAAFGDDVQLGDFNDYDFDEEAGNITVMFKDATAIEANHPYIIKVGHEVTEFTVDGVDVDPQEAVVDFDTSRRKNQPRQMVGTYVAQTELEWGTLFLSGGQFWYSTGLTRMKAFRAYFNFYDLIPDFEDNYESRQVKFRFDDDGTTTRVDNVQCTMNDVQVYDLQGRAVSTPAKGIYVRGGKKIIIK